ncbi:MAG TPA: tetratricopeptide repeat protein [Gemmatimonadales bacterium]|nr:tetratricopeptide repeat protein [Gemmatimonadales bacterium]
MPICATYSQPDPETLLQRARELADQGRLDDARHLCQAALQQERLSAEGHRLLAAIYQEQGEIAKALEALRRALYLEPNSAEAHFLHGSLLLRQGKRRAGLRSMETVVSLLRGMPSEAPLGGDGVTAARLMEMAHMYVEAKG